MYFLILLHSMSIESCAFSFPSSAAWCTSRRSDIPQSPMSPLFLLRQVSSSCAFIPVLVEMYEMIAGSMSPLLVPMTRPSSGVRPMDVSTHTPFLTAHADAPFPIWSMITFVSLFSFPRRTAALFAQ